MPQISLGIYIHLAGLVKCMATRLGQLRYLFIIILNEGKRKHIWTAFCYASVSQNILALFSLFIHQPGCFKRRRIFFTRACLKLTFFKCTSYTYLYSSPPHIPWPTFLKLCKAWAFQVFFPVCPKRHQSSVGSKNCSLKITNFYQRNLLIEISMSKIMLICLFIYCLRG